MNSSNPVHIIGILWGTAYSEEDVNTLFAMIRRNTSREVIYHLFSDEELPRLHPDIVRHPEPHMAIAPEHNRYAYRKEAGLCADNLGGLTGQRVFFFDLDILIMDNLDDLFAFPQGDRFYIINDWNTRGNRVGQASCYSFVVGTLGFIRGKFEAGPQQIIEQYGTASQEYLSDMVAEHFGGLNFWPEAWCKSFKFHCLPWHPLRHIKTPSKPPQGTKLLAFHGHPDIHDALAGRWSPPNIRKAARGWKKLYKACRPTPWIQDYYHCQDLYWPERGDRKS